ncbi:peptidylprolyl isomerase [Aquirufa sp. LEPPI-3A]|uniref:peptidylprolyl isomerase n=1 Tax=Aquirufa regiilacus TaxID=3024868 RepID=UPI0028DDB9EA|nr:peptidylprolyl isomerase [Aquirufa sp. LEPPI-3A]MDT8886588.1 peptidylprolyl isomerase [Aquirufa sp. LEPPI-3A]
MWAQQDAPIQLGSKKISAALFEKDYRRLLESDSIKSDNKQKFLSDYIDYQLKILAAEDAKIPQSPAFQDEYQSFRKELASPYLIDGEKSEALVKEAYQRLKFEKQVGHILVKLPQNPSIADTLIAYQKIDNIRKRVLAGEIFEDLAKKFSEDDLSALKGGNIGFVTSLQTQYAFENAVYALEKGGISGIVRTSAGYHLIKILDVRPNQGKIRLAHILVSVPVNAATNLQVDAKNRIDQVQKYLEKGDESFELICKNYSEDPYSKGRGGELRRWYYSSDLSEELQSKLFTIQRLGDYTEPIRTNLGWQIFKLLDKKPLLSYDEMAEYLRQKVVTDPERSALIRTSFMKRVKSENKVVVLEAAEKLALERFAQDRIGDEYYLKMPLLQVSEKTWTIQDFYQFIVAQQKKKLKALGYLPTITERTWLDEFIDIHTLEEEEKNLETKYPAFKEQMQEFFEGNLYSKIIDQEIFEKSLDSLRQQAYFQSHAAQFTMPARIKAKIIDADTPKTLADGLELLGKSPYPMNKRLPDIGFALGQVVMIEGANKIAQELFILMAKNRDYVIELAGYQDASEADTLSEARVNHLVRYLVKKGISAARIIERVEGTLKPVSKTDKAKNARVAIKFYSQSMDDVVKRFNAIKPQSLIAEEGYFIKGQNPLLDGIAWEVGKQTKELNGRHIYLEISQMEPERLKRFDESRSSIIRELQVLLEKDWLTNLKQRFPVVLQTEELNRIMQ